LDNKLEGANQKKRGRPAKRRRPNGAAKKEKEEKKAAKANAKESEKAKQEKPIKLDFGVEFPEELTKQVTKGETARFSTVQRKKFIVDALKASMGVVSPACELLGLRRATFYEWYREDKAFKKKVDSLKDYALDFAETKLHQQMKDGNTTALIFFLKTQGKKRGYAQESEKEGGIVPEEQVMKYGSKKITF